MPRCPWCSRRSARTNGTTSATISAAALACAAQNGFFHGCSMTRRRICGSSCSPSSRHRCDWPTRWFGNLGIAADLLGAELQPYKLARRRHRNRVGSNSKAADFRTPVANVPSNLLSAKDIRRSSAQHLCEGGTADLISYGARFLANPDLPLARGGPYNSPHRDSFYGGAERGY